MEDNKYIHQFYNGLDHSWEDLYNSLPQFPNGWGKTVFTDITIDLSFYHILWQLIKDCKSDVLEKIAGIVEKMNVYEDRDFHRLTPEELYKALAVIGSNAARVLLSRFECTDGIYNELVNSLSMRKQARFIEALINCNTTSITQITQCIRFLQRQEQLFEYSKKKAFCNNPDDTNVQCIEDLTADYSLQAMELNNHQMQMKFFFNEALESIPKIIEEIENKDVYDGTSSGEDNDSFCSYKYFTFFFRYCKLRDSGVLNTRATMSFEYLFKLPAVRGLYDEGMECWKNSRWKEKLSEFELRLQDTTTDEDKKAINEIEPPEPTSTPLPESDQEDKTDSTGHLFPGSKYEFVPENYFEPDCISKGYIEEHYELVERVKKHGLRAFVDFINYIASEGFIENTDENKALFAYRLTGRMRPEKLDTIIWFKEKGEPKELYYIIKYFSPRSRKKFSKQMKDYFENDYFGDDSYSRTAEDVSDDFKNKLEDLFPGLTNTSKG